MCLFVCVLVLPLEIEEHGLRCEWMDDGFADWLTDHGPPRARALLARYFLPHFYTNKQEKQFQGESQAMRYSLGTSPTYCTDNWSPIDCSGKLYGWVKRNGKVEWTLWLTEPRAFSPTRLGTTILGPVVARTAPLDARPLVGKDLPIRVGQHVGQHGSIVVQFFVVGCGKYWMLVLKFPFASIESIQLCSNIVTLIGSIHITRIEE